MNTFPVFSSTAKYFSMPWLFFFSLFLLIFSNEFVGIASANTSKVPHFKRVGNNLLTNAAVNEEKGWTFSGGATYDSSVTRTKDGSGALKMGEQNSKILSEKIPVVPGKTYTLAVYMKDNKWPAGTIKLTPQVYTNTGAFKKNARGTRQAVSGTNMWQESVIFYTAGPDEKFVRLMIIRKDGPGTKNEIWLDDAYIGEGVGFEQPPVPKKAFHGSKVRVDHLGNFEVLRNHSWEPFFPLCIFADQNRPDWTFYSKQGFNCNMWGASAAQVRKAKNAVSNFNPNGMMSGFSLAPFTAPFGWAYSNLDGLRKRLEDIKDAGLSEDILTYYWDNEKAFEQWTVPIKVTDLIKQVDTDNKGKRMHPIFALQGNHGVARMYHNGKVQMTDVVGTYLAGDDGGQGGSADGLIVLENIYGQQNPVTFGQINRGVGKEFRSKLYNSLIQGARGMGFWRDFFNVSGQKSVDQWEWWNDLPNLRREIDRLLPIIRQPHWTEWTLAPQKKNPLSFGTRDYEDEGYVILVNTSKSPVTVTYKIEGLDYQPQAVHDFFTDKKVSSVSKGSFTITLPGYGIGKGTAVYRLAESAKGDNEAPDSPKKVVIVK